LLKYNPGRLRGQSVHAFQVRLPRLSFAREAAMIAPRRIIKDIINMAALLSVTSERRVAAPGSLFRFRRYKQLLAR
jgi:hypothetical protein